MILSLAPPANAAESGSIGLRLVDAPKTDDPRARLYIVDHLSPGTVIERRIEVSNTSDSTTHVALYAAAATIERGSFVGSEGQTANELSTWTSVSPYTAEVPADGLLTATITIDVPADAPAGEQYGVIWAEARSGRVGSGNIVQVNRVGIRVYLSVGPGGPPAADFTIDSLTAERSEQGGPVIRAAVHNTGGRALDMNGSLRLLNGPSGLTAGPFTATLGTTLAVGATGSVTILLDEAMPAGPWDARITLRSGLLERGARAQVTFPVAGAAEPVITRPDGLGWLPFGIVGASVLIAILVIVWILRRRRGLRMLKHLPAM